MKRILPPARGPRFKIGDNVTVVAPGPEKGKQGHVFEVVEGLLDYVHRYHVRFPDGTSSRFFGFDLELSDAPRSKTA